MEGEREGERVGDCFLLSSFCFAPKASTPGVEGGREGGMEGGGKEGQSERGRK